ncbi:MAG TPA: glycosyltransferase family 39 protein [Pyrinomonadaceae bacterium]|nr:glycosyltransferase family 39 protein [Pyrinomonadaceae bacterium]
MYRSTIAKRSILILLLLLIVVYCFGLGHLPLVGPDEPRYAQVAREMFLRGDLITPTLGGRPWFEKPVLLYWMMIGSFKLFGVSEWAARLPSAISGVLTVIAVFYVGQRISGKFYDGDLRDTLPIGFWSALVTATTVGIAVFSRAASFDIVLTMTTTWALAFYADYAHWEWERDLEKEPQKRLLALLAGFYVFIGLSLLAKGLIGVVIPVGVLGFYYLYERRLPERMTLVSFLWGVPLALLVAASWYVPVIAKNGWPFVDQFFIQHHFVRYISNKYHHAQPPYYYLIVVPLLALPWTLFLISALWKFIRQRVVLESDEGLDRFRALAIAWFLFPLLFFSFSGSKLPGYILPVLPAAAILVGERLWRFGWDDNVGRGALRMTGVLQLVLALGFAFYVRSSWGFSLGAWLVTASLILVGLYVSSVASWRMAVYATVGLSVLLLITALYCFAPRVAETESSKRLLQLADQHGYSQSVIYGMQRSDRTPEFYAAGRIVYGADGEPIMYEAPWDVVQESLRRKAPVLTFVPLEDLDRMTNDASAHAEVIGNNGRYAIVAVRAL